MYSKDFYFYSYWIVLELFFWSLVVTYRMLSLPTTVTVLINVTLANLFTQNIKFDVFFAD